MILELFRPLPLQHTKPPIALAFLEGILHAPPHRSVELPDTSGGLIGTVASTSSGCTGGIADLGAGEFCFR